MDGLVALKARLNVEGGRNKKVIGCIPGDVCKGLES